MAEIPKFLLRHTASVEPLIGSGAYGETYAAARPVQCFAEDKRQLVRNPAGDEVVSETTLYCRLVHDADFPLDSRVSVNGRVAYVLRVARHDDGGLGAWQHLEVSLT